MLGTAMRIASSSRFGCEEDSAAARRIATGWGFRGLAGSGRGGGLAQPLDVLGRGGGGGGARRQREDALPVLARAVDIAAQCPDVAALEQGGGRIRRQLQGR